ncbi:MAG: ketoacyl-ACP synthase III [bacterium]|nr:ketoacyl-ACP synthase III [bacterium]
MSAKITGTGSFTPPRRMTNADLEKIVDTSDQWILERTGIRERRIADETISCADMATEAARNAMAMANCAPEDVEMIIDATVTPDYTLPSNGCLIQEKLGLVNAVAFDIVAACTGFINGLTIARGFIESGMHKKIVVIGSEKLSSFTNWNDRTTCVLFGDAAGAVVVEPSTDGTGILASFMKSDGRMRDWLCSKVGGNKFPYTPDFAFDGSDKIYMSGTDVFKVAVKEMGRAAVKVIEDAGYKPEDVSLFIPHQANMRIIESLMKRLNLNPEKVFINIEKYGNTSSASVPLALDEANRSGRIKSGDLVLMVAFGGGMIWGSALVRW